MLIEFTLGKTLYQIEGPEDWKDLNRAQLEGITPYLINNDVYRPEVLSHILKLDLKIIQKIPAPGKLALYETFDWMNKPNIYPPFEFVKIKGTKYYTPSERLDNTEIIEFAFLDMCFIVMQSMEKEKNKEVFEEYFNRLCAYMLRPAAKVQNRDPRTYTGDPREVFNTELVEERLKVFDYMKAIDKFLVLFYFMGCKKYIEKRYQNPLFPPTHTKEGKEIMGVVTKKQSPIQWIELIQKLSGGKFGTLAETRRANTYDFLNELKAQMKASQPYPTSK